jgi:hypothetical protein
MKKPKPRPRLRIKTFHDLACSQCGQINRQDVVSATTFAFCSRCQENTQHYSIATRQAGFEIIPQKSKSRRRRGEYSPSDKKKMGFGKVTKKEAQGRRQGIKAVK